MDDDRSKRLNCKFASAYSYSRNSLYNMSYNVILLEYICSYYAGLLSAGGMGLWHGVEYYEKEKIVGEEYYQQWSNVSSQFNLFYYQYNQNDQ